MAEGDAERAVRELERLGEEAFEPMYEAHPALARDRYEEARGCLFKAVAAAKRAGLALEATRLTGRLDHMASVYHNQFRGIGR